MSSGKLKTVGIFGAFPTEDSSDFPLPLRQISQFETVFEVDFPLSEGISLYRSSDSNRCYLLFDTSAFFRGVRAFDSDHVADDNANNDDQSHDSVDDRKGSSSLENNLISSSLSIEETYERQREMNLRSLLILFLCCDVIFAWQFSSTLNLLLFRHLKQIQQAKIKSMSYLKGTGNQTSKFNSLPTLVFVFQAEASEGTSNSNLKSTLQSQILTLAKRSNLSGLSNERHLFTLSSSNMVYIYNPVDFSIFGCQDDDEAIASLKAEVYAYDPYRALMALVTSTCNDDTSWSSIKKDISVENPSSNVSELRNFGEFCSKVLGSIKSNFTVFEIWFSDATFLSKSLGFGNLCHNAIQLRTGERTKDGQSGLFVSNSPIINFSERLCNSALLKGKDLYLKDIPHFYTREVHNKRFLKSSNLYKSRAKGPFFENYLKKLQKICENYWNNGHQRCERLSLTQNPCIHPIHEVPSENPQLDSKRSEHVKSHATAYRCFNACDCGKNQFRRHDPFSLEDANCSFYKKDCCSKYIGTGFPFVRFESEKDVSERKENVLSWFMTTLGSSSDYDPKMGLHEFAGFLPRSHFLYSCITSSKMKSQTLATSTDSFYVGFDYECPSGHRTIQLGQKNYTQTRLDSEMEPVLNSCSTCKLNNAQVKHLYVVTPPNRTIDVDLVVSFKLSDNRVVKLGMPNQKLQSRSFYSIRFPYVYLNGSTPLPKECGYLEKTISLSHP